LISGMSKRQFDNLPYKEAVWKFFSKDDDYINQSVNAVMGFIEQQIK
jgi:hypothetical protein